MSTKTRKKAQQTLIAKLQSRAEGNLEVLSELRFFMREKAKLDDEYGRGLEKLVKTMQNRKLRRGPSLSTASGIAMSLFKPKPSHVKPQLTSSASSASLASVEDPEYSMEDGSTVRAIYSAYLAILIEADKAGRARAHASERSVNEISEFLKDYTQVRSFTLKKTMDFAIKYQTELHASYDDFERVKATYDRLSKETESAKRRYEETAKKPNSGLNALKNAVSRMDGEERVEALRQKWKSSDANLAKARNDYLLAIAAANSQQTRFYESDLAQWMQKFDNDFHATAKSVLSTYSTLESGIAKILDDSMNTVRFAVNRVDQKADTEAFVFDNTSLFTDPSNFSYESYPGDFVNEIAVTDVTKTVLGQKLSHLLSQSAELASHLEKKQHELAGVKQLAATYTSTPQFGNSANTIDQIIELENAIDLIKCIQSRVSTQVHLLENANVTPVSSIESPILPPSNGIHATNSSSSSTRESRTNRREFVCVYSYDSKVDGELSISEGDLLTSEAQEAGGWILAQSDKGEEGLVPFNYIQETATKTRSNPVIVAQQASISKPDPAKVQALYDYKATCEGELTLVTGDVVTITSKATGDDAWWEGISARGKGLFPSNYVGAVTASSTGVSARSSSSEAAPLFYAEAVFDYTAADESELSFRVGDVVGVVDDSDGDWWMAVLNNQRGLVPASYVTRR
ncbi:F-BAR and double SH3 domains protein 1 [Chytriomyces hyalinus]|nr:F-BAR and double SH3 domains protein 1 [Chytriomyces hyalinus]